MDEKYTNPKCKFCTRLIKCDSDEPGLICHEEKEPTPNYELLRQRYIERVRYAMHVYKEEVKRGLDCMWIGEDGRLCEFEDCNKANIEKAADELDRVLGELEKFYKERAKETSF